MYARCESGLMSSMDYLRDPVTNGSVPVSPWLALLRRSDALSMLALEIPNKLGSNCSRYGIGNDALMLWRCCEKYAFVYHVKQAQIHLTEPELDEPGISAVQVEKLLLVTVRPSRSSSPTRDCDPRKSHQALGLGDPCPRRELFLVKLGHRP